MEENKQGYVDTPERIDAFHDAIWDSGLSMRAKVALHGMCESPAQLKEVIDNDFTGRRFYGIGVKTKAEIRAFFDKSAFLNAFHHLYLHSRCASS